MFDAQRQLGDVQYHHESLSGRLDHLGLVLGSIQTEITESEDAQISRFLDYSSTTLVEHFREEEQALFSTLLHLSSSLKDKDMIQSMVQQLLSEHALIESMVEQLRQAYAGVQEGRFQVSGFVLCAQSLRDFLRVHNIKEKSVVFYLSGILQDQHKSHQVEQMYSQLHEKV